jgi:hypothetical protein
VTLLLDPPPTGGGQAVSRLIDAGSVQFDIRAGGPNGLLTNQALSPTFSESDIQSADVDRTGRMRCWMSAGSGPDFHACSCLAGIKGAVSNAQVFTISA